MVPINERRFNRWAIAALISAFVLLGTAFAVAVRQSALSEEAGDRVSHTFEVLNTIGLLETYVERAETASRGWLLLEDPARIRNFHAAADQILPTFETLKQLTSDNPVHQRTLERLKPDVMLEVTTLEAIMDRAEAGDAAGARALFNGTANRYNVTTIRTQTAVLRAEERRLLSERRVIESDALRTLRQVMTVVGVLLLALAGVTFFLVRRFTNDLLASRARLHVLNTNLEGAVAERTADLKRANEEIQRFAYIVSHDLRSPLVNVMGFTSELDSNDKILARYVDQLEEKVPGSVPEPVKLAVKEDLPEAVGFIRSATEKMDLLINAILALSRQGRRVLSPESLDMNRVIGGIVDSLATLAEEREAQIKVEGTLPTIEHDRLAIEQIFQNLIENATKYLQPGRPGLIKVRGKVQNGRARFEVEDNGRGVAPHDLERIFELFRRAGTQDQRGEGIGLANVRALAYRLGGTVDIRSSLGQGSTFIVDLPIVQVVEREDE